MDRTSAFEAERPRLTRIATQVLRDPAEAQDVVQTAWLRLHTHGAAGIENLPGWLTTVTVRLCLDRLRARVPEPVDHREAAPRSGPDAVEDPAEEVVLADTVGVALQVMLDRFTPSERVAFVLHDTFEVDFPTIAQILGRSPAATRKLASRARAKVRQPVAPQRRADAVVVDAFLAAARQGDVTRLLELLAPDALVQGDAAAVEVGTPARIEGREAVARMFDGGAAAALSVLVDDRPGAAWFLRGMPQVAFDFTVQDGLVRRIDLRADPGVLASLRRRTTAS
ncbi:RNA polymerase subunit sigma-70 [Serinicoccus chungangensis]|uniref:RNA polymerase subunit sigma-70 n=1 Tax=Serinicoccus chungangensis TaxID=767452 RepID=A0A0W8IHD4_9MICO|nr:sigma-70 family RNA polymerase sigma factor [Serinicoccus chungangensis]KUG59259.1 RNA polymerase subunit sigma-70 [Serinicoccus chungangensis]